MKDCEYKQFIYYIYAMVCWPIVLMGAFVIFKCSQFKLFSFIASLNGVCTVFAIHALWIVFKIKALVNYRLQIKCIFLIIINTIFQLVYALIIIKTHSSLYLNWPFLVSNLFVLMVAIRMLFCEKMPK